MKPEKVWNEINPAQFLRTLEFADCTLIGKDGQLKAHKFVLGAACPLLKKAMLASEAISQEQETAVSLPDFGVYEISKFLDLIYGISFEDSARVLTAFDCVKLCPPDLLALNTVKTEQVFDGDIDFDWKKLKTDKSSKKRYNQYNKYKNDDVKDEDYVPTKTFSDDDEREEDDQEEEEEEVAAAKEEASPVKRGRGRPPKRSKTSENQYPSSAKYNKQENATKVSCEECGKKVLLQCLASHMANKHLKKPGYECCECDHWFSVLADFNHHIVECHEAEEEEGRKCKHCDKAFAVKKLDKLELHEFQCMPLPPPPRAGKYKNRRRQAPITNIEVKLNEENPNECPYEGCKYTNDRTSRVKSHYISRHCRQKCPYCGNMLAVTSLEQHIIMQHTKNYGFVCHICSKGFVKQSLLTHHIDEEHIKELKHICDDCGKGFFSKLKLNTHKYWAHKNNDWRCDPCGKKYTCQGALIKHLKRHHNGEGIDKLYKNEKGEYKQIRNYKHVTDNNTLMIQTVQNDIIMDNCSAILNPYSGELAMPAIMHL